jgi:hypothetical protein
MDRARFDELKDAYVLGALTEEERPEMQQLGVIPRVRRRRRPAPPEALIHPRA